MPSNRKRFSRNRKRVSTRRTRMYRTKKWSRSRKARTHYNKKKQDPMRISVRRTGRKTVLLKARGGNPGEFPISATSGVNAYIPSNSNNIPNFLEKQNSFNRQQNTQPHPEPEEIGKEKTNTVSIRNHFNNFVQAFLPWVYPDTAVCKDLNEVQLRFSCTQSVYKYILCTPTCMRVNEEMHRVKIQRTQNQQNHAQLQVFENKHLSLVDSMIRTAAINPIEVDSESFVKLTPTLNDDTKETIKTNIGTIVKDVFGNDVTFNIDDALEFGFNAEEDSVYVYKDKNSLFAHQLNSVYTSNLGARKNQVHANNANVNSVDVDTDSIISLESSLATQGFTGVETAAIVVKEAVTSYECTNSPTNNPTNYPPSHPNMSYPNQERVDDAQDISRQARLSRVYNTHTHATGLNVNQFNFGGDHNRHVLLYTEDFEDDYKGVETYLYPQYVRVKTQYTTTLNAPEVMNFLKSLLSPKATGVSDLSPLRGIDDDMLEMPEIVKYINSYMNYFKTYRLLPERLLSDDSQMTDIFKKLVKLSRNVFGVIGTRHRTFTLMHAKMHHSAGANSAATSVTYAASAPDPEPNREE